MNMLPTSPTRRWLTWLLLLLAVAIPAIALLLPRMFPVVAESPSVRAWPARFEPSPLPWERRRIGPEPEYRPLLTNVQVIDFDGDGRSDVLACDARRAGVFWYRATPNGQWEERPLLADWTFGAPAHATVVDLDRDDDSDVLVAVLGSVWPTDERVGRVVWLENRGDFDFAAHVVADDLRRVADVQAADLDGDQDVDLAVAVFGFDHGRLIWLENRGDQRFQEHALMDAPGPIHVPIADYDGDGDLDLATVFTQEEEEVWGFENLGGGTFAPHARLLYHTSNHDLGGAGLVRADLDQDGDPDLLFSAGDNLELMHHYPQPYHGCIWLENRGDWTFQPRRLAHVGGTYAADCGDLDGDGDLDVVLASMFNDWSQPGAASVVWLENDGRQNFRAWQIADRPISLCTLACGDLNGDGRADIVAGGLHIKEPFDRLGRITAWLSPAAGGEPPAAGADAVSRKGP